VCNKKCGLGVYDFKCKSFLERKGEHRPEDDECSLAPAALIA